MDERGFLLVCFVFKKHFTGPLLTGKDQVLEHEIQTTSSMVR